MTRGNFSIILWEKKKGYKYKIKKKKLEMRTWTSKTWGNMHLGMRF